MNLFAEEHIGTDRAVVGHAYETDVAAVAYASEGLVKGLLSTNSLHHAVRSYSVSKL